MSGKTWFYLVLSFLITLIILRLSHWTSHRYEWTDTFFIMYSVAVVSSISLRLLLAASYQAKLNVCNEYSVSIVIPVYCEQKWIEKTIRSCYQSGYDNLLEVIVVDDGSTDNTINVVEYLQNEYPTLKLIRQPRNLGKREAMVKGTNVASGEIVLFIDSDSFLDFGAIRWLVWSFTADNIAAVGGHAHVYQKKCNMLEKMQQFNYFASFRIYKSCESIFGVVSCLSGCIAAYRREILLKLQDEFLNQKFLGRRPTAGDDRSLTTLILKHGYKAVYQPSATCTTVVPDNIKTLTKQRLRWRRSWIRETILQAKFFYKLGFFPALLFYPTMFMGYGVIAVALRYLIIAPIMGEPLTALAFIVGCLAVVMVLEAYCLWHTTTVDLFGSIFFFAYNTGILLWTLPIALATIRERGWETRATTNIIDYSGVIE